MIWFGGPLKQDFLIGFPNFTNNIAVKDY